MKNSIIKSGGNETEQLRLQTQSQTCKKPQKHYP